MYGYPIEDNWIRCWWCHWEGVKEYNVFERDQADPYIRMRWSNETGELRWYCTWCFDLDEPTLRPNNRDRCHEWLLQAFPRSRIADLHPPILRLIAEYLADNVRGGDKILCPPPDPRVDPNYIDSEIDSDHGFLHNLPPIEGGYVFRH